MRGETVLNQLKSFIYALPLVIFAFWKQLGLTVRDVFYIMIGCAIVVFLLRVSSFLERGVTALERGATTLERGIVVKMGRSHPNPGSSKSEKEERVTTSGAGVFAGMVAGGTLGFAGGPIGVLVGGVIGAILGNLLEYEGEKARVRNR